MTERPADEAALIRDLRNMQGMDPDGNREIVAINDNLRLIARGLAKVIEVLPDHNERGYGNPAFDE